MAASKDQNIPRERRVVLVLQEGSVYSEAKRNGWQSLSKVWRSCLLQCSKRENHAKRGNEKGYKLMELKLMSPSFRVDRGHTMSNSNNHCLLVHSIQF